MVGRWILYSTGVWDFKIDKFRMGRSINLSSIGTVEGLRVRIALVYGVDAPSVFIEMSYWIEDPIPELMRSSLDRPSSVEDGMVLDG
ncbi:unnamed protein product [Microthlaspi erraticum]|uniref:Uncharacterized protein n=1 Tax=Microthlaspi erraticum TaxID=1685480 RepID=A0A6D2KIS5_9BRAS|nr:unnamed protein product [Microthlaspi erraticum]